MRPLRSLQKMPKNELAYDQNTNLLSWEDKQEKSWVSTSEGMMNTSWDWGWWQQNRKPLPGGGNETVEACVSILSETVSMCPINHLTDEANGHARRNTGSWVERVLRNPNSYTTRSLFFNNLIRSVYFHGNGYAYCTRDGNAAINGLYLLDPRHVNPVVDPQSGEAFYWVSPNFGKGFNQDTDVIYMPKDMLNVRIVCSPDEPLKGLTPIHNAANSISANSSILKNQANFFENNSRPSGILSTPDHLTKENLVALREAFEDASQGINAGKVPILGNGMKWDSMSLTSQDAQMIEAFNMTTRTIAALFRIPPAMINDMSAATFSNAETMNNWFLSSRLGFLLDHIELELNRLFGLPFDQRCNFDVEALLRTDTKTQMETYKTAVTGGIVAINEARKTFKLPPVPFGDEPRVQQQMVPLSGYSEQMSEPEPEPIVEADITELLTKGFSDAG